MGKMSYFSQTANSRHISKLSSLWQCWQNKEDVATANVMMPNFVRPQCSAYSHRFQYFLKFHSLKSPSRFLPVLKRGKNLHQYSQIREAIFKWRRKAILRDWIKKEWKETGNLLGWRGTANFSCWNWTTAEPRPWVWAASGLGLPLPGQVLS